MLALISLFECKDSAGLAGLTSINGSVSINDTLSDEAGLNRFKNLKIELYFDRLKAQGDLITYAREDGTFSFFGLSGGQYWIRCTDYRKLSRDSMAFYTQPFHFEIKIDEEEVQLSPLVLKDTSETGIRIKVLDKDSQPLPGIAVYTFANPNFLTYLIDSNKVFSPLSVDTTRKDGTIFKKNLNPNTNIYAGFNVIITGVKQKGRGDNLTNRKSLVVKAL